MSDDHHTANLQFTQTKIIYEEEIVLQERYIYRCMDYGNFHTITRLQLFLIFKSKTKLKIF